MSEEDKRYIKERLASQIAAFMMQHGLIEFTQHKDPSSSAMMIRGRVYVAPDDQVRIIRTLKR
jgi:non-ribosomal peptide synthetase component E (peptide arylation enzyme)